MEYKSHPVPIKPRLIIHGGAGNILPSNLSPERYTQYHDSLLKILAASHTFLTSPSSFPLSSASSVSALDTVTFAVSLLEDNPLFNSGKGAVFTRDGIQEMEASVMVSKGKKKRGVGVMGLEHVKNPIKLAREMLLHGEEDSEGRNGVALGAQGHAQLHKFSAEKLAKKWGLEIVEKDYFFVQARWDEHIKGLAKESSGKGYATWDSAEFVPQGTCGAVALDSEGVVAVATSTGGMTNKLTGRIGDTPTLGAGFWAEEWESEVQQPGPAFTISEELKGLMADCLPSLSTYLPVPTEDTLNGRIVRSTASSGTGNGDSFLRTNAARTASAIARYRQVSFQEALNEVSGAGGELQKSAGDRWKRTGEGEGGFIGIELHVIKSSDGTITSAKSAVSSSFNCGGMYRAEVLENGKAVMRVWQPGTPGLDLYKGEGEEYDLDYWFDEKL